MSSLSLGPDRDRVLDHAAQIVSRTWAEFDVARDTQPETSESLKKLLTQGLPREASDPIAVLDIAAEALDSSLAQSRPRYLAYIGSSGLEIGALGDLLAHSHDPNLALVAHGRIYISPAEIDGSTWLRPCFINFRTTSEDVQVAFDVIREVSNSLVND